MTGGILALERLAPSLPMQPGKVERREFEYTRYWDPDSNPSETLSDYSPATGLH
jgi:hypothetical protein